MVESSLILIAVGLSAVYMAIGLRNGRVRSRFTGRTSTATSEQLIVFKVAAPFIGVAGGIVVATGVVEALAPAMVATASVPSGVGAALVVSARHWQLGAHRGRSRRTWRRGESVNECPQLIPSGLQDPEEILLEAKCGARVGPYEHHQ